MHIYQEMAQAALASIKKGDNWDWLDVQGWEEDKTDMRGGNSSVSYDAKKIRVLVIFRPLDIENPLRIEMTLTSPLSVGFSMDDYDFDDYNWMLESSRILP